MKQQLRRILIICVVFIICFSFTCCKKSDEGDGAASSDYSTDTTESPTNNNTLPGTNIFPPIVDEGGDDETGKSNFEDVTVDIKQGEAVNVDLAWHMGRIDAKDSYVSSTEKYSYSDIIIVKNAGTTITFVDDNTNDNGDSGFATSDALVISSWKKSNIGEWLPNAQGVNYAGTGTELSDVLISYSNGIVTYSYTTVSDNECIVLCFRSGQTEAHTPNQFPIVKAVFKNPIVKNESGDGYADGGRIDNIF